jgi:hypothetical protein
LRPGADDLDVVGRLRMVVSASSRSIQPQLRG